MMMAGEPSDDEALWRFSLAFYAAPRCLRGADRTARSRWFGRQPGAFRPMARRIRTKPIDQRGTRDGRSDRPSNPDRHRGAAAGAATKAPVRSRCGCPAVARGGQGARTRSREDSSKSPRAHRAAAWQQHNRSGRPRWCCARESRTLSRVGNGSQRRGGDDPGSARRVRAGLTNTGCYTLLRRGFERSGDAPAAGVSPQRRTCPVSRPKRSRMRPSV